MGTRQHSLGNCVKHALNQGWAWLIKIGRGSAKIFTCPPPELNPGHATGCDEQVRCFLSFDRTKPAPGGPPTHTTRVGLITLET